MYFQVYSPYKPMPLASQNWLNRGTIGDFFSILPFHGNYAAEWNKFALSKLQEESERGNWGMVINYVSQFCVT